MAPEQAERRLAAIMFTDIVRYTALIARDEEAGRRARDRHEALVRPLVERHAGQLPRDDPRGRDLLRCMNYPGAS